MAVRLSVRLRHPMRLVCRVRCGRRDLVLVAAATAPRLRYLTVLRTVDLPAGTAPPELLPAA